MILKKQDPAKRHDPEKWEAGFRKRSCPIDKPGSNSTQSIRPDHQWFMM
jgi:hypothetical protein